MEGSTNAGREDLVPVHGGLPEPVDRTISLKERKRFLAEAEGLPQVGRFVVSRIAAWEDILDGQGRTMVSSWQAGDDHFSTEWV